VTPPRNDAHTLSLTTKAVREAIQTERPSTTMHRTSPPRRRSDAGRVAPHIVGAVALVVLITAVGVWTSTRGGDSDPGTSPSQPGSPSSSSSASVPVDEDCVEAGTPPLVDLGVQAATGRPQHPQLTVPEVRDLITLAKDAGADVISTSVSFRAIRPFPNSPGRYEGLDRVINGAREAGLQVRLRLMTMPRWSLDEPDGTLRQPPRSEEELARWSKLVTDLMKHVQGRVEFIEVWNEPNAQKYWTTGPDPIEFARLLSVTYDAVKKASPDTVVITGGLSGNDIGFLKKTYDAIDKIELDASPFDQVGVHPFAADSAPGKVDEGEIYERDPYGLYDNNYTGFESMHDVMKDHGDGDKPVFISAFGYSTRGGGEVPGVDDATRATYLGQALDIATCSEVVSGFSWYAFQTTPWDPPAWTMLDARNRPNKTYQALQSWTSGVR